MLYANFYDNENNCLFSIEINTEREGEHLADRVYQLCHEVEDWTITDTPFGEVKIEEEL